MQVGDRLALVWKYGEPYPARIYGRYMFHDIGLALVDPKIGLVEKTSLVDDVKCNSSPDITWHDDRLVYVYNMFEHLYGARNDPGTPDSITCGACWWRFPTRNVTLRAKSKTGLPAARPARIGKRSSGSTPNSRRRCT